MLSIQDIEVPKTSLDQSQNLPKRSANCRTFFELRSSEKIKPNASKDPLVRDSSSSTDKNPQTLKQHLSPFDANDLLQTSNLPSSGQKINQHTLLSHTQTHSKPSIHHHQTKERRNNNKPEWAKHAKEKLQPPSPTNSIALRPPDFNRSARTTPQKKLPGLAWRAKEIE